MHCQPPLIFISYSHDTDSPVALLIYEILTNMGYEAYIDRQGLLCMPDDWRVEVEKQIEKADKVIFVCSPAALKVLPEKIEQNNGMGVEYKWALANSKKIVPLSTVPVKDIFTEIPKELKNKNIFAIPWDSGFIEFKGTLQKVCKTIITVNDVIAELEKQIENCAACYSYYHKYQLYKELFDLSLQLLAKQEDIQQNIQKMLYSEIEKESA